MSQSEVEELLDLVKLAGANWAVALEALYDPLKAEIQGGDGFIRRVKEFSEEGRKLEISAALDVFKGANSLAGLDQKINSLADTFWETNRRFSAPIYYDHISLLAKPQLIDGKPVLVEMAAALASQKTPAIVADRLKALLSRLVNESLSQANKSNAGGAGENLVRAVLLAAGLEKDKNFREQYKSKSGSDTDFAFPNVADGQDQKVLAFVAVQMSSNDRTRLTSSELKTGAKKYAFTGNGLNASKKNLQDIGDQIVEGLKSSMVILVCYGPEIAKEKQRIATGLAATANTTDAQKLKTLKLKERLEYFEHYTLSIEDFANTMKKQFS